MAKAEKRNSQTEALSRLNQLTLRCGDCLHFKGTAHPQFGAPCSTLGVKAYAAAPPCYMSNVQVFRKAGPHTFATLAGILSHFTPQQSRVLMGLLKSVGSLEKHGLTFLQKVYFHVGEDYLDNYFSGRVLGVGVNGTISVVGENYFHNSKTPIVAYLFPDSVLNDERFQKRKNALTKKGLVYAPRKPHRNEISGSDYEPPTMETSPEMLEKMASKQWGKKKKPDARDILEVDLRSGKGRRAEDEEEPDEPKPKKAKGRSERDIEDDDDDDLDE